MGGCTVTPEMLALFNRCVDTGTALNQELLAELVHPDPAGDHKEVRKAVADELDALADLADALQIMRR